MNSKWECEDFRSAATKNRRKGADFATAEFEEKLGPERKQRKTGPGSTGEYPLPLQEHYVETVGERAKRTPRSSRSFRFTPDYREKSSSSPSRSRSRSRSRCRAGTLHRKVSTPRNNQASFALSDRSSTSRKSNHTYRCGTPGREGNRGIERRARTKTPIPSTRDKNRTKNITARGQETANEPHSSRTVTVRSYRVDEKILCRAEDGLYYEAKIIKITRGEDGTCFYRVHFTGWNKTYDETVHQNEVRERFLNFSLESLKDARMAQAARRELVMLEKKNREKLRKRSLRASSSSRAETSRKSGTDKVKRNSEFTHTMQSTESGKNKSLRNSNQDTALLSCGHSACSTPTVAGSPIASVAADIVPPVEKQKTSDFARLHLDDIGRLINLENGELHDLCVSETTPDWKLGSQLKHIRMIGEVRFIARTEQMWMRVPNEGPLAENVKNIKEALSQAKAVLQSPYATWNEYFAAKSSLELMIDSVVDSANKALGGGSENDKRASGDFVRVPDGTPGSEEVIYLPQDEDDLKPLPFLRRL